MLNSFTHFKMLAVLIACRTWTSLLKKTQHMMVYTYICLLVTLCTYLCTHEDIDGEEENAEFMKKLAYLRTHAQVFLSMLNDMRRRLKELPPDAPTAQQYRCVGISYKNHVIVHPNYLAMWWGMLQGYYTFWTRSHQQLRSLLMVYSY